jgi:hypothetical protein
MRSDRRRTMDKFEWTNDWLVGEHCEWKGMHAYASGNYAWVTKGKDRIFDSFNIRLRIDKSPKTSRLLCEMVMRCAVLDEVQAALKEK